MSAADWAIAWTLIGLSVASSWILFRITAAMFRRRIHDLRALDLSPPPRPKVTRAHLTLVKP